MLTINRSNYYLNCKAENKKEALRIISDEFIKSKNVTTDCFYALSKRENQISTYISNGVAIPHLSKDDRTIILKSDIKVFQFPQGVMWGESHIVFITIAVLSKNDNDHIDTLKALTPLIKNDVAIDILSVTKHVDDFDKILSRILKIEDSN